MQQPGKVEDPANPGGEPAPAKPELKLTPVDNPETTPDEAPPRSMDYRQQYESLKGKYNAEVPRLNAEVNLLKEQIKSQQSSKPAAPEAQPNRFSKVREELGDDLGDVLEGAFTEATAAMATETAGIKDSMATLQQTLNQYQARDQMSAQERFFADLDNPENGVTNWESVYNSKEFVEWARQVNPLSASGETYHETINKANDACKSAPIIRVFHEFFKSVGYSPAHQPGTLNEQIVPAGRGGAGQPIGEVRQYTTAEIQQFQKDVARGKYRGPEGAKEVARITAEIQRSLQGGRPR